MRHILFISLLFFSINSFGQVLPHMIKIGPDQTADSAYVIVTDTTGESFAGRGKFRSLYVFANMIEPYLSVGGLSDGDKGDITVSGSGATWNIDANTIGDTELSPTTLSGFGITDGANTSLSNLSSVAINSPLLPGASSSIGINSDKWESIYTEGLYLSSGSNNIKLSSSDASTVDRTLLINLLDANKTLVITGDADISGVNTGDQDLSGYATTSALNTGLGLKLNISDTAAMLAHFLERNANLSDLTSASTARTNLGATTLGGNFYTLANPSAVRYVKINADNTITLRTAAEMLSDLGASSTDLNGIYSAANEGGTAAVSIINVDDDGLYFSDADATGYWGYEPGALGLHHIDYDARAALYLQNLHGSYGTYIDLLGQNAFNLGVNYNGNFEIIDGTVEPFRIEASTTVDNSLLIQADGDVQISDYPNSRDDGSPTNILGTDGNGVIQSYPVADAQLTTEQVQDIVGAMVSGNTETNITVDYQDADGTIDFVASAGSGTSQYIISPAQLTADQDNYNPTGFGIATHVRISSDNGMRAITSMVDSTGGVHEKTIINVGSYLIYFPQDHPDGTAANRFTGYPGDYYLYPGASCQVWYDATSSRWRAKGGDNGYTRPTSYYSYSTGSTTFADYGDIGFHAAGTGTNAGTAATTSLPAANQSGTGTGISGGGGLYFAKGVNQFAAFESAHQFAETTISIPVLSDATDTYFVELQLTPSGTSATLEQNNTFGIRYSHGNNSGKWELFTQDNAAAESLADLGITVAANTIYKLRIELDKAKAETRAYINGVFLGRVTGTIPNSVANGARILIQRTAGSTNTRLLNIHNFSAGAIYP